MRERPDDAFYSWTLIRCPLLLVQTHDRKLRVVGEIMQLSYKLDSTARHTLVVTTW
jgi:hypothetical protein